MDYCETFRTDTTSIVSKVELDLLDFPKNENILSYKSWI